MTFGCTVVLNTRVVALSLPYEQKRGGTESERAMSHRTRARITHYVFKCMCARLCCVRCVSDCVVCVYFMHICVCVCVCARDCAVAGCGNGRS